MDYTLQKWRGSIAANYVCHGDRLLDVGCYDGWFLTKVRHKTTATLGLERDIPSALLPAIRHRLLASDVVQGLPFPADAFDVVSLLAVFEHLTDYHRVVGELARVLRPGGRVILTVPGGQVDHVLSILITLGVADGMSLEEHHGYQAQETPALFATHGFEMRTWHRFQFGLNNLFVFEKS